MGISFSEPTYPENCSFGICRYAFSVLLTVVLDAEVNPHGISTTVVNSGFFRTELQKGESATYAEPSVEDYADRTAAQKEWWTAQSGLQ